MAQVEAFRRLVEARAGAACEYCRLLQAAAGVTFHIEHFRPRSLGGRTIMANLVLSCPGCNLARADRTEGEDLTGQTRLLFNPRDYEPTLLGWHLHFTLDHDSGFILPRDPTGEATLTALRMNDPLRVFAGLIA
ncbi:MAG: HNH endonuclease [Gemmataceae bacterium]